MMPINKSLATGRGMERYLSDEGVARDRSHGNEVVIKRYQGPCPYMEAPFEGQSQWRYNRLTCSRTPMDEKFHRIFKKKSLKT